MTDGLVITILFYFDILLVIQLSFVKKRVRLPWFMRYLFDTDHLSVLQKSTGQDYQNLSKRMERIPIIDFAISIVTVHEQLLGSHTYINRARDETQLLRGYEMMTRLVGNLKVIPTLGFDRRSLDIFKDLKSQQLKIGTMDLRIASISISHNLTLLTRNHKDFNQIPKLLIEDWTSIY